MSHEPLSNEVGQELNGDHYDEDLKDDDGYIRIGVERPAFIEQPSNTAGADDTKDGGDAYVEFQRIEPLVGKQRPGLRQCCTSVDLCLSATGRAAGLHVRVVSRVDSFRNELDHDANI